MVVHMALPSYADDEYLVREAVAAEVRAQMARKHINGTQLAKLVDKSEGWVSRHINGHVAFDVVELAYTAKALGCTVNDLTVNAVMRCDYDSPMLTSQNRLFDVESLGRTHRARGELVAAP